MIPLKLLISFLLIIVVQCTSQYFQRCHYDVQKFCPPDQKYWDFREKWMKSDFPPLTADIAEERELRDERVDCLSKLECYKNASPKEIREDANLESVSILNYDFESHCFFGILFRAHRKYVECAKDHDFRNKNGTMNKDVFTDGKDCLLKIAETTCKPKNLDFLKENYDELIKNYFQQTENEDCESFYDKLYFHNCKSMGYGLRYKLNHVMYLNATEEEIDDVVGDFRDMQKCTQQSCHSKKKEREKVTFQLKALEKFPSDSTETLKNHPNLRKLQCLENRPLLDILGMYVKCVNGREKKPNCVLSAIAHKEICQKEIVEQFEKNGFKGLD